MEPFFHLQTGPGPVVAVALHDGHGVRPELRPRLALEDEVRLREEDPFTAELTRIAPTRLVARRSRFEVDLNRPRDGAVYRRPEDAWGLRVWRDPAGPPEDVVRRSLEGYDRFYGAARRLLEEKRRREGGFVVYDIHAYNHRRGGPDAPPACPSDNPDVNLGTGSLDRDAWGEVVDAFLAAVDGEEVAGRRLDARENVRFRGGHFVRWIHETFPTSGCGLAIELKKWFMDEWTGEVDRGALEGLRDVLGGTIPRVRTALERCRSRIGAGA